LLKADAFLKKGNGLSLKGCVLLRKVPVLFKIGLERGRKGGCLEKIGAILPTLMQPHPNQLRVQA
jgi:hypothetical protein